MHGLIFETSVCYWQNQPGCYLSGKWIAYNEDAIETIALSLMRYQTHYNWCFSLAPHAPHDRSQKKVSYVKLALVSHSFRCLDDTSSSHLIDPNSLLGFGFRKVHKCFFQSDLVFALSMYRQRRLFWPAVPINSLCCERLTETSLI